MTAKVTINIASQLKGKKIIEQIEGRKFTIRLDTGEVLPCLLHDRCGIAYTHIPTGLRIGKINATYKGMPVAAKGTADNGYRIGESLLAAKKQGTWNINQHCKAKGITFADVIKGLDIVNP